jgi:hypothetical protein
MFIKLDTWIGFLAKGYYRKFNADSRDRYAEESLRSSLRGRMVFNSCYRLVRGSERGLSNRGVLFGYHILSINRTLISYISTLNINV